MFTTRDEGFLALRRRQTANGFSNATRQKMEYLFDRNV